MTLFSAPEGKKRIHHQGASPSDRILLVRRVQNTISNNFREYTAVPRLTLPNHGNAPTLQTEFFSSALITLDVGPKLLGPIFAASSGIRALGAARMPMPVATVNEYNKPPFREYEVWGARQVTAVEAKSQPQSMRGFSYAKLGQSIFAADARHQP